MSAGGCNACTARRRAGLEGQCPACANERARRSRAVARPGWRRDPDGTVRWAASGDNASPSDLSTAIAVAFDRALRRVADHPTEVETISAQFSTWIRGYLEDAVARIDDELEEALADALVYPSDGRSTRESFRERLRKLLGLP